ncbi:MAG: cyclopropane-fatty-acyl-phospholipid synthase family protein [Pseudomonadota bacterium]
MVTFVQNLVEKLIARQNVISGIAYKDGRFCVYDGSLLKGAWGPVTPWQMARNLVYKHAFLYDYVESDIEQVEGELWDFVFHLANQNIQAIENSLPSTRLNFVLQWLFERSQKASSSRQTRNIQSHYDLGNAFYAKFLDPDMHYTCAVFDPDHQISLAEAQQKKLALVHQRCAIEAGHKVLDIGCGWGGFMNYAKTQIGAQCHGITISAEQAEYITQKRDMGNLVHLEGYLEHSHNHRHTYDRIVSIGMFEHVGKRQFRGYFDAVARMLNPGGKALIHTMIRPEKGFTTRWIHDYIFPGGYIPAVSEVAQAIEESPVRLIKLYTLPGRHYARTLQLWRENLQQNYRPDSGDYDHRLSKIFNLYLCLSRLAFAMPEIGFQIGHFVLEHKGSGAGLKSVSA